MGTLIIAIACFVAGIIAGVSGVIYLLRRKGAHF